MEVEVEFGSITVGAGPASVSRSCGPLSRIYTIFLTNFFNLCEKRSVRNAIFRYCFLSRCSAGRSDVKNRLSTRANENCQLFS